MAAKAGTVENGSREEGLNVTIYCAHIQSLCAKTFIPSVWLTFSADAIG